MALNTNPSPERPDHTHQVVGSTGDIQAQEPGTGKPIYRRGGDEAEADIDIATANSPRDLIGDGDFDSGNKNAGGAEALAGDIISDDNNTFTVFVDWLDNENNITKTHSPPALTDVTDVEFNLVMRSDRFKLRVEDTSGAGQNNIHGTANAH